MVLDYLPLCPSEYFFSSEVAVEPAGDDVDDCDQEDEESGNNVLRGPLPDQPDTQQQAEDGRGGLEDGQLGTRQPRLPHPVHALRISY